MLSPFRVSPPKLLYSNSSPCFCEGAPLPTHFDLTALASPYTGAWSLHRTKGLSSH